MSQMVLSAIASAVASGTAHAGLLLALPQAENAMLLALGLTGLTVGWLGARKRPDDRSHSDLD
jgi:spore maturation protein SpmA